MISEAVFRGRGSAISIGADTSLYPELFKLYSITATTTGLKAKIADARRYTLANGHGKGGRYLQVLNVGANTFSLCTDDGVSLTTLTTNQWATVSLLDNTTQAGVWALHVGTAGSAALPAQSQYMYYLGGNGSPAITNSQYDRMHEFKQDVETWTLKTSCDKDRTESSCATVGGVAFYMGTGSSTDARFVEHYDPDTWTTGTALPGTSANNSQMDSSSTASGKAYLFGGANVTTRTLQYDGTTWTTMSSRPSGRGWSFTQNGGFPGFDIANGTTYLLAGGNTVDEGHNYVDSYVSDTYAAKTERPLPVFQRESRCKNDTAGEIFVLCGHVGFSGGSNAWSNRVTKYIVASDTHSTVTSFPESCGEMLAASYGSKAYCGFANTGSGGTYVTTFREFDLSTQTYRTLVSGLETKRNRAQNQATGIQP